MQEAIDLAAATIDSGKAAQKLDQFIELTKEATVA